MFDSYFMRRLGFVIGVATLLAVVTLFASLLLPPAPSKSSAPARRSVPVCQTEDQVIVGFGRYADGLWEHYRCVQRDVVPTRVACERISDWYRELVADPNTDYRDRETGADARAALCSG